jgi:hypothetical protein
MKDVLFHVKGTLTYIYEIFIIIISMPICSSCGKTVGNKDSVYKDEETDDVFCGICYIKHLEEGIEDTENEVLDLEPVKKRSQKFVIFLMLGIILIIAEILILSDTGGGKGPARVPERKEGAQESGSIATRIFFIKELLMNYEVKHGDFPITLSLLTPEFVEPEIEDENIFYELEESYGFVLYSKDSKGRAINPVLSAKGEIELSKLKTMFP